MWLWRLGILSVLVLGTRCSNNGQSSLSWPAHIASYQGFSESERSAIRQAILEFNEHVGSTVIDDDAHGNGSEIRIILVPELKPLENSSRDPLSQIAGRATVDESSCDVELAEFVVRETERDLIRPVTWHELGHCTGLRHVGEIGHVMYKSSMSFSRYQASAIDQFFDLIRSSVGIEK